MHQIFLMIPVVCITLIGVMNDAHAAQQDDAAGTARIRVYQEADITLYPGEYCYGSDSPAAIHAGTGFFSMLGLGDREGMPQTDDIAGSYSEYVIAAGKPLTVKLQWEGESNGVKASCGPVGSTFYPLPGRDYDVTIGYAGSCFVQVRELFEITQGKFGARSLPSTYSFACNAK